VLDNPDNRRLNIEHLTTLHTNVMHLAKTRCPQPTRTFGASPDHLIRIGDLFQGLPRCLAHLDLRRTAWVQAWPTIRRQRFRRIPRIVIQSALQLRDTLTKLSILSPQQRDLLCPRSNQLHKLVVRRPHRQTNYHHSHHKNIAETPRNS
jgi:hypothetical protein